MRVLNDRDEKAESQEMGFFPVAFHSLACAAGIYSFVFTPLPMIAAHTKLADPWPKVAALIGALITVSLLQSSMILVVVAFVFGIFVSDCVARGVRFWNLVLGASAVALVSAVVSLGVSAQMSQSGLLAHWTSIVDAFLTQLRNTPQGIQAASSIDWAILRTDLIYEGPALYLAGMAISLWLSIGIAAHFGVLTEDHAYSGARLRKIPLTAWGSVAFVVAIAASRFENSGLHHLGGTATLLLGTLMFIQGTIYLSEVLSRKGIQTRTRTLIYPIAIIFGFYAVVGIGMIAPWAMKRNKLEEVI